MKITINVGKEIISEESLWLKYLPKGCLLDL